MPQKIFTPRKFFLISRNRIQSIHCASPSWEFDGAVRFLNYECLYATMKEFSAKENSSHGFLPELGRWQIISTACSEMSWWIVDLQDVGHHFSSWWAVYIFEHYIIILLKMCPSPLVRFGYQGKGRRLNTHQGVIKWFHYDYYVIGLRYWGACPQLRGIYVSSV